MLKQSEYIIWIVETREEIIKHHPDWSKTQVNKFLDELKPKFLAKYGPISES